MAVQHIVTAGLSGDQGTRWVVTSGFGQLVQLVRLDAVARAQMQAMRAQLRLHGVKAIYNRGGSLVTVDCLVGKTTDDQVDADDYLVRGVWRDYIIPASELLLSGVRFQPARGDTITLGGVTWQVLPVNGANSYRPHDARGQFLRVHTKQMTQGAVA